MLEKSKVSYNSARTKTNLTLDQPIKAIKHQPKFSECAEINTGQSTSRESNSRERTKRVKHGKESEETRLAKRERGGNKGHKFYECGSCATAAEARGGVEVT